MLGDMMGKSDFPLVSICMPVYNGSRFLKKAIESVLVQTYQNFELLVFDDASMDESWAIIQSIIDPRLKVFRNEKNLGPEVNWNKALLAASGKYIKVFHQDDLLAAECLASCVAALERRPENVLCFSDRFIIGVDGRPIMKRSAPWGEGVKDRHSVVVGCLRAGTNLLGEPSVVLFRRDIAEKVGGFDGSIPYLIDLDYWIRLMEHGTAYYLKQPLVSFRISSGQWSVAMQQKQYRQFICFVEKLVKEDGCKLPSGLLCRAKVMAMWNQLMRRIFYLGISLLSYRWNKVG